MSDETTNTLTDAQENSIARKNATLYAACQALVGSAAPISITLGGIAGYYLLGPDKSLATLPVTGFNVGAVLMSIPAALLMQKIGRRYGFMSGAMVGILGCLLAVAALYQQSFWMFVASIVVIGCSNGFAQQYRFAAADRGTKEFKPKAISIVLIGGVGAAIVGPQLILNFKDFLSPVPFAGAFLWAIGLYVFALIVMSFLAAAPPKETAEEKAKGSGRPLSQIMAQPKFIVSVFCAISTYALMAFVMTAAPLAMIACGFDIDDATWGIQWHVLAMFLPSFFTGNLIARFGKEKIVATGLLILAACAVIALQGIKLENFYIGLILLGLGWNFGFIGATAMLTETYEPHEKSKVQGANDFMLFGTVAIASFLSGLTLNDDPSQNFGWDFINWIIFPVVGAALLSLLWLRFKERKAVA
ncbi:MAG: MFS transporter [Rhizobiales bacterium]|nr:MFS transporter [Hyphomicrobiales bacterium]